MGFKRLVFSSSNGVIRTDHRIARYSEVTKKMRNSNIARQAEELKNNRWQVLIQEQQMTSYRKKRMQILVKITFRLCSLFLQSKKTFKCTLENFQRVFIFGSYFVIFVRVLTNNTRQELRCIHVYHFYLQQSGVRISTFQRPI